MSDSRISGLYRLGVAERIEELLRREWISASDAELLRQGRSTLSTAAADRMIENVVGVFSLPFAVVPNFIVNGKETLVPMAIEEPSVVAAASAAAQLARATGGFRSECSESLQIGQIHVAEVDNPEEALANIAAARDELLQRCNSVHPGLINRGGGVRDIESRSLSLNNTANVIAIHLLVDTCDAMGANLVNTICEAVAARVAELCGGNVALRILSNLADRSLVTCRVRYALDDLQQGEFDAETVRDQIVLASDIASVDPYRAATHNKGILNGVDALVMATGNDWRAVEAGAHAYAATTGQYRPLATWTADDNGDLIGEIVVPLKVGIVGGNIDSNPGALLGLQLSGVASARELAELAAAVGLAQNFAALKALATSGIQEGHMKLHARSAARTTSKLDDQLGEEFAGSTASGKVILLGEHAVVYGRHALALPIPNAVGAIVSASDAKTSLPPGVDALVAVVQHELDIDDSNYSIEIQSRLSRGMGLGSSAAVAVAIVRAFDRELGLGLDDERINAIAFECEKLAHGTPSGIDNTVATYATPMLFCNSESLHSDPIVLAEVPPIVIGCSSNSGRTSEQVAGVRERYDQCTTHYDAIFDEIDALSKQGAMALAQSDYASLGAYMNICHGLLSAIEVSTAELDSMVRIARAAGAVGAKLTGGGGGGCIVALCPDAEGAVSNALHAAGFRTMSLG